MRRRRGREGWKSREGSRGRHTHELVAVKGAIHAIVRVREPCDGVADQEALEVWHRAVGDDRLGERWQVVTSIAAQRGRRERERGESRSQEGFRRRVVGGFSPLARQQEPVARVLREGFEEALDEGEVVARSESVAVFEYAVCHAIPHADRLLYVDHIGEEIPSLRVESQSAVGGWAERPILREEAYEARAAGSTVGPKQHGVICRCGRLRLDKPVE